MEHVIEWQLKKTPHTLVMLIVISVIEFILGITFIYLVSHQGHQFPVRFWTVQNSLAIVFIMYLVVMLVLNGMAVATVSDKSYRAYRTENYDQFQMIWTGFILRLVSIISLGVVIGITYRHNLKVGRVVL